MIKYDRISSVSVGDEEISKIKQSFLNNHVKKAILFTIAFFIFLNINIQNVKAIEQSDILKIYNYQSKQNEIDLTSTTTINNIEKKFLIEKKGRISDFEKREIKNKRTENKKTFILEKDIYLDRVYNKKQWYKDDNKWYDLDSEIITEKELDKIIKKKSLIDKILMIRPVFATTTQIFVSTDGLLRGAGIDWSEAWGLVSASTVYNSVSSSLLYKNEEHAGGGFIYRSGMSWDLDLPDDVVVSSTKIFLFVNDVINGDNDGLDYIHLSIGDFATTSLIASDYNVVNFSTTSINNLVDISDIADDQYNSFDFNNTGIQYIQENYNGWIKIAFRGGHDVENQAVNFGSLNSVSIYYSEQTGTANDPYIEIIYQSSEIMATTTLDNGGRIDFVYLYDSAGNINYYQIPFLNWLLIFIVLCFCIAIFLILIKIKR